MIWGGVSTDSYSLDITMRTERLDPPSHPTLVWYSLGSSWFLMPWLLWWVYVGRSWRMKESIPLTSPQLTNRTPLIGCFSPSDATRLHLRLSRSSVMFWSWEEMPGHHLLSHYEHAPCAVRHANSLSVPFQQSDAACQVLFHFNLQGVCRLIVSILSFLTHFPISVTI